ncbi:hypothetical protein BU16DRAFT_582791 [Lophium mytilinum]|uniref:Uncharacterized protein n=1 Tax=Lophium mytilinum TaxID=390894 RepID=A0A6A6QMI8_9PEZI|nr:hypothetical protein BU16DRAFT_582791 [Lophium mytilinum]
MTILPRCRVVGVDDRSGLEGRDRPEKVVTRAQRVDGGGRPWLGGVLRYRKKPTPSGSTHFTRVAHHSGRQPQRRCGRQTVALENSAACRGRQQGAVEGLTLALSPLRAIFPTAGLWRGGPSFDVRPRLYSAGHTQTRPLLLRYCASTLSRRPWEVPRPVLRPDPSAAASQCSAVANVRPHCCSARAVWLTARGIKGARHGVDDTRGQRARALSQPSGSTFGTKRVQSHRARTGHSTDQGPRCGRGMVDQEIEGQRHAERSDSGRKPPAMRKHEGDAARPLRLQRRASLATRPDRRCLEAAGDTGGRVNLSASFITLPWIARQVEPHGESIRAVIARAISLRCQTLHGPKDGLIHCCNT